jgi:preprotein translocase subunit SecG
MNWLHSAVVIVHLLIAAAIVALVLLQRGKGADAGAGFGAGASGTVFGARGSASFLSRTTATLAALFIATSLTLAYLGGRSPEGPKSVIERVGGDETAPAAPSGTPALPNETPAVEGPADAAPASEAVETPATPAPQPAPGGEAPPQQ